MSVLRFAYRSPMVLCQEVPAWLQSRAASAGLCLTITLKHLQAHARLAPTAGPPNALCWCQSAVSFTSYGNLSYKGKRPGWKRKFIEGFTGMDLSRDLGRLMRKESIYDRAGNRRFELVVDPQTGDVIHHCDEPLTEHTGRGSARTSGKGEGQRPLTNSQEQ